MNTCPIIHFRNDRSLEQKTAGKIIVAQVEDFLPGEGMSFESVLDVQMVTFS